MRVEVAGLDFVDFQRVDFREAAQQAEQAERIEAGVFCPRGNFRRDRLAAFPVEPAHFFRHGLKNKLPLAGAPAVRLLCPDENARARTTDPLAAALDDAVVDGGFRDAGEVAREALRDYLSHRRFALQERHQMDDIAAALAEAKQQQRQR